MESREISKETITGITSQLNSQIILWGKRFKYKFKLLQLLIMNLEIIHIAQQSTKMISSQGSTSIMLMPISQGRHSLFKSLTYLEKQKILVKLLTMQQRIDWSSK